MARFSEASLQQFATLDPRLQRVLQLAIQYFDFKIIEGHRNQADQEAAFARGASQLHWPNGRHNSWPSRAVDIAPYPVDWDDNVKAVMRFAFMMGVIRVCAEQLHVKVRFGMDWNRNLDMRDEDFIDAPHVELDEV